MILKESVRTIRSEKGYLRGRYGAIPFFGSFDFPTVSQETAEAAP